MAKYKPLPSHLTREQIQADILRRIRLLDCSELRAIDRALFGLGEPRCLTCRINEGGEDR